MKASECVTELLPLTCRQEKIECVCETVDKHCCRALKKCDISIREPPPPSPNARIERTPACNL